MIATGGTDTAWVGEINDMSTEQDRRHLADEFHQFLIEHPEAHLRALDANGARVGIPETIEVLDSHQLMIGQLVDLVAQADQVSIVTGWNDVVENGRATTLAALAVDGHRRIAIHWFDVRTDHDVVVAVVIPDGESGERSGQEYSYDYRPRLCRMTKDGVANITEVDEATVQMFGFRRDVLIDQPAIDFLHPDDHHRSIHGWLEMIGNPGRPVRSRLRHRTVSGDYRWVEVTNTNRLDENGGGWVDSELLDISEEMAIEESLRQREELLSRLAEALPVGILQLSSAGEVEFCNDRLVELTGADDTQSLREHLRRLTTESRAAVAEAVAGVLETGLPQTLEAAFDPSARYRFCDVRVRALLDGSGEVSGAIVCVTDTTDSSTLRQELEVRASVDALTGCLNRDAAMRELEQQLEHARRGLLLSFIDINNFKAVNDNYGHAAGDRALRQLSMNLLDTVRAGATVGRLGGDEFIVASPSVAFENRHVVSERIRQAASFTMDVDGQSVEISAAVGSTWTDDARMKAEEILAIADADMYEAKEGRIAVVRQ